ncbi:sodium:calcium antiporter [Desulfosporosinus sp. OT]|uniref:sodium:calcium antiporter n=1 Tax=Desulfosporosinus sp. OT TaxID=913865 RepID=UPI0002239E0B|nr:sodium:calcium antiporter [Desulfosporosinus sp. OT]EGW40802.1 sodium/calcium exchanger family protein [Desulfosporosinus sp. OT]
MALTFVTLIISAILIYLSCELFVNGIEWVGLRYNISKNAVGTILAAFGTALPESVVTFIAVVFGTNANQKDIGVGAALGGPLVLSTLAYAIVGLGIIFFRKKRVHGINIDLSNSKLGRDQLWFLGIFVFKVALGFVVFRGKPLMAFLFLAAYGLYFFTEMKETADNHNEILEPLKFRPKTKNPETRWVLVQTFLSLALIAVGSQVFVKNLDHLSLAIGIAPHIIALFLSPIATELPEILNAVIWVRQGKERLALANISGSMMIQATVPSALGILFTPWIFDSYLALAGFFTMVSIAFLWLTLKKYQLSANKLVLAAGFYVCFVVTVALIHS